MLALLLSSLSATAAWACSCAYEGLDEQLPASEAVFRGVVERVRAPKGQQMAGNVLTVRPTHVWKGDAGERLEVIDGYGQGGAACGQDFEVGADVLFLVRRTDAGWQSGLCSGTERYSAPRASDIAALLGAGTEVSVTPLPPLAASGAHSRVLWWVGGALAVVCVGAAILVWRHRRVKRS